jgi:hypothetical protein
MKRVISTALLLDPGPGKASYGWSGRAGGRVDLNSAQLCSFNRESLSAWRITLQGRGREALESKATETEPAAASELRFCFVRFCAESWRTGSRTTVAPVQSIPSWESAVAAGNNPSHDCPAVIGPETGRWDCAPAATAARRDDSRVQGTTAQSREHYAKAAACGWLCCSRGSPKAEPGGDPVLEDESRIIY